MFDIKTKAELTHLNVRGETHGDETVPAMDVKMTLLGVPIANITSAVEKIHQLYDGKTEHVLFPELNPHRVGHKIENLRVTIGEVELKGVDVKKGMELDLQPNGLANVKLSVQLQHAESVAESLLRMLGETVDVVIGERQQKLEAVN